MKAVYENHYLTDNDVANYARHSFADLAKNFTPDQNANLIRFLARGMKTGDWVEQINQLTNSTDYLEVEKLVNYLRKTPKHWVPFGHPHISLRMSAPVPIRTQCFKHKIGYVESEESRRYISCEPVLFIPEYFRSAAVDVKQGSGSRHSDSEKWKWQYIDHCNEGFRLYREMIDAGVCPEQARFVLAQGTEVTWAWTGSLYAFSEAYNARSDSHAQQEIQDLFKEVNDIIAPLYPISWKALTQ